MGLLLNFIDHRLRCAYLPVLLLSALTLTACQPRPIEQPIDTALSASMVASRRVEAIGLTPDAQALELMPLVTSSRHPILVRRAAVDRMIQADAHAFWDKVKANIRRVDDWPMITLLAERAADDGRRDFTAALVMSWARPSVRYDDNDRPERAALERLTGPQGVEASLWTFVCIPERDAHNKRLAEAAWTVLARILPHTEQVAGLRARVGSLRGGGGLQSGLHAISDCVDHLPSDREALLRLRHLLELSPGEDLRRYASIRGSRPPGETPRTLALRHLPVIDHADADALRRPRQDMLASLTARLTSARHVSRGTGDTGRANIRATPDRLADHAEALGWADLLVIDMLLDAMQDPALTASLFEQAERDRQDTTTEHGGVLLWRDGGSVVAQDHPPMMRRHDEEYLASDACVRAMYTGLAHYHFHGQRYDNAAWAGPGGGDFRFADNLHANCVVFTFIDRDTLNVDVYFPGEIVIDLGCIHR